jgi:hypothetical protein
MFQSFFRHGIATVFYDYGFAMEFAYVRQGFCQYFSFDLRWDRSVRQISHERSEKILKVGAVQAAWHY